jgi:hypothetical protein
LAVASFDIYPQVYISPNTIATNTNPKDAHFKKPAQIFPHPAAREKEQ